LGDESQVNISIVNTGDEAAYNVVLTLLHPEGFSSTPIATGVLEPSKPFEGKFTLTLSDDVRSGTYPLILLTNYADANSYPFSTVSARFISVGAHAPIKVVGSLSPTELEGSEQKPLTLKIRNMDDVQHEIETRLYLPQELKSDETVKTLTVPAKGEVETVFQVSSFGALGGSTYAVFATLSHTKNNIVHSAIAGNAVRIAGGVASPKPIERAPVKEESKSGNTILYILLATLAALVSIAVIQNTRKK